MLTRVKDLKGNKKRHNGFSSIIAIIYVGLFAALSIAFTAMCSINVQMAQNHHQMAAAQASAESGLQYSRWLTNTYTQTISPGPLSAETMVAIFSDYRDYTAALLNGTEIIQGQNIGELIDLGNGYQFTIPSLLLSSGQPDNYALTYRQYSDSPETIEVISNGTSLGITRSVRLEYTLVGQTSSPFEYAIYSKDTMSLSSGVTVTGYNFEAGDDPLRIGTSSTNASSVALNHSATVDGDVIVGYGGDPDDVIYIASGASYTGSAHPMDSEWEPPVVEVPAYLSGSPSQGTINNTGTITTSGKYDSICLGRRDVLTIDGHVEIYVTGNVNLGNTASIRVESANPDSSLTLYLGGNLAGSNNASLNNETDDSRKMMIIGLETCESFSLAESGAVTAALYLPNAHVEFNHNVELHGAVISESFTQNNGVNVYYDANLRDSEIGVTTSSFSIVANGNSYSEL
ncbi:MAG: hypothetical protein JW860_08615 [Sedimentisphaerales bacterium]|nr:hypothetical protein [Sedimentisphaerales bacterium]